MRRPNGPRCERLVRLSAPAKTAPRRKVPPAAGAAGRLAALESSDASLRAALERDGARIGGLEALAATDLSRCGFVRYDAFTDSEAGLSYALALLNRQGDGVVVTSIYTRDGTRTFGKPVAAFKPTVQASPEELEAIERARSPAS